MSEADRGPLPTDLSRDAESVLKRFGYAKVARDRASAEPEASFWVQEAGVPRRTYPVFLPPTERPSPADGIDRWLARTVTGKVAPRRAIFVVPSDAAAEEAWARLARAGSAPVEHDVSILVVPAAAASARDAHFALRQLRPTELLRLATGVVVGLFRKARDEEGNGSIDFAEMLQLLRRRFGVDVHRSLGVTSDEDALFLLYQLAQRDTYAPGDAGSNLHLLVLKPTGPAARLPWFAA